MTITRCRAVSLMSGCLIAISLLACYSTRVSAAEINSAANQSINILLITSGCCHDYDFQTKAMQLAFENNGVSTVWTVVNDGGTGTAAEIDYYNDPNWSKNFDVVIHNECFAKTTNGDYIRKITRPHHQGTNAVVIHCTMHTYRDSDINDWREMLGVTSRRHEHKSNYVVNTVAANHPIMNGFPDGHEMPIDELYIIEKQWPNMVPLATSKSETDESVHPVFWTNRYGKAKIFGTTYGHSNDTFKDKVFLDTLVKGTQWAAGRL